MRIFLLILVQSDGPTQNGEKGLVILKKLDTLIKFFIVYAVAIQYIEVLYTLSYISQSIKEQKKKESSGKETW